MQKAAIGDLKYLQARRIRRTANNGRDAFIVGEEPWALRVYCEHTGAGAPLHVAYMLLAYSPRSLRASMHYQEGGRLIPKSSQVTPHHLPWLLIQCSPLKNMLRVHILSKRIYAVLHQWQVRLSLCRALSTLPDNSITQSRPLSLNISDAAFR